MPTQIQGKQAVEILFFGDLVGRPGRSAAKRYLASLSEWPDVVIANVENASHGFGFSQKQYKELQEAGIQVFTGGNHIWDRKDIFDYIQEAHALVRPDNFPAGSPGFGYRVFEFDGFKLGVINLIGQVFMGTYNSPWDSLDRCVAAIKEETPLIFLDFHAEATAEKVCMAHYAAELGLSAMVGTHTHVQTADERILKDQMGCITDAGFNGSYDSVIGMEPASSLKRLKTHIPVKLDVADSKMLQVNGIRFWLDVQTGACLRVKRLNLVYDTNGSQEPAPEVCVTGAELTQQTC